MPRVEGAKRKQFAEWIIVNKTENKYKFVNLKKLTWVFFK